MMKVKAIGAALFFLIVPIIYAQDIINADPFWLSSETNVYSTGMVWRDANNDGYIDVFFANGNDIVRASNFVYISSYGELPGSASWYSSNAEYTGHGTVGDVDDNGYPDFAVSNFLGPDGFDYGDVQNLYLNDWDGLNTYPDWYANDTVFSFSCAFGDADGDGDLDLAVASGQGYGGPQEPDKIYFNVDGQLQSDPGWESDELTEAMDVTWGDVDNDGDLDLAFCYDDRGSRVYYNNGGVLETTPSFVATIAYPANTIIFGDINGDGWRDLIVAFNNQNGGYGYYRVHYNNGDGTLETYPSWRSGDGDYGSAVSVYDYDNDGDDDLAAGRWWDRVRIYENLGDSLASNPVWQANPATVVEEIAWIDVDGDGVERRQSTFYGNTRKLFYTEHHPLQSIDSVLVDGTILNLDQYCFDPIDGWVSLGDYPNDSVILYYQYSFKNDLTISNWDTSNMAFGNTRKPYIDFYADTTVGWVPFTVQFTDSSEMASSWMWRFGDGDSSILTDPVHTYLDGGAHDVTLYCDLPDEQHNRTNKKMILTLADTVYFPEVRFAPGDTIKVPIYLRNTHPLHYFVLPLKYGGDMDLDYIDYDTDSCRTDYFGRVNKVASSSGSSYLAFTFSPSYIDINPPLEPGYGRIINLYFTFNSGSGYNALDTVTFSSRSLLHDADYFDFQPAVVAGFVSDLPIMPGDADGNQTINILDVTFLIEYLYQDGPEPWEFAAGDPNLDGVINILDIVWLIDYLYGGEK